MRITAKQVGKKAVRIADSIVNLSVLVIILLLVAIACYAMWDANLVYTAADAKQYDLYKPTVEDTTTFEELRAINPEVFSWLTVYGTHIDYPVTQSTDNLKYVNTSAKGAYSLSGAIFLDSHNSSDYTDFNSVLYGHHMEKQAMFGELDRFSQQDFFEQHPYGNLFYDGQDHGLEFFAFVHTDAYDTDIFQSAIMGEAPQQTYLEILLAKAIHTRDIGVSLQDRIVILTTCSSETTNGRDILAARITDTVYEDTFQTKAMDDEHQSVDAQPGFFAQAPLWLLIAVPVILLILLIIVITIHVKRKRKWQ